MPASWEGVGCGLWSSPHPQPQFLSTGSCHRPGQGVPEQVGKVLSKPGEGLKFSVEGRKLPGSPLRGQGR